MKRKGRRLAGAGLILAGLLACFLAGILHLKNLWLEQEADDFVQSVLPSLEKGDQKEAQKQGEASGEEPVFWLDKNGYLGILSIPSLELRLPVMADYEESLLKLAPCRYRGTVEGGDLIIAGHNYRKQFSPIRHIQIGAEVIFTDAASRDIFYQVKQIDVVDGIAVADMVSGEWDMTLFTCTLNHVARVAVRCVRAEKEDYFHEKTKMPERIACNSRLCGTAWK